MSENELRQKFVDCVVPSYGADIAGRLFEKLRSLATIGSVTEIADVLARRAR